MHWTNAVAVLMMIASGWRIWNNDPIFPAIEFPVTWTLGGEPALTYRLHGDAGFGNALLWHFAFMWLLVLNGLAYLAYGVVTGRFRRMLWPIRPADLVATIKDALRFKLGHDDVTMYNAVQKVLYVGVMAALVVIVAAGLAIWKPVQLHWLTALFGGFQGARLVHFLAMSAIVAFLVVHVALALLVPRTLLAMVTGGPSVPARRLPASLHTVPGE
ncbi:cytochrome b/b6 domain-containing protein [Hyphomicrobiales bacterium BP6-180914]|uniref:Cytochrome b/b6 domain-containing protein n=2 Tax=Lichenifustis flavocetrariae TaxID=2949735 RepID=A0AA41Z219_9HYPH|nr:cytochrome b/b6 domain-containing protein [Lichenifustis flavocetrariae]